MYLGLDLSLTGTGLCLLRSDYTIAETCLIHNTASDDCTRLFLNQTDLTSFLSNFEGKIDLCCIEGPAFGVRDGGRLFQIGEWTGVAKLVLYGFGIPFIIAAPSQLKKYISGTGSGVKKELIMLDIYKKYNVELRDNNIADSYVLSRIARDYQHILTKSADLDQVLKYQQDVLNVILKNDPSYKRQQHSII